MNSTYLAATERCDQTCRAPAVGPAGQAWRHRSQRERASRSRRRRYVMVVCMSAWTSHSETFRRSPVAWSMVSANVCLSTCGETRLRGSDAGIRAFTFLARAAEGVASVAIDVQELALRLKGIEVDELRTKPR